MSRYDRGTVALHARALSLAAPDETALAWVWNTFTNGLSLLAYYKTRGLPLPSTPVRHFEFEYETLRMLARAWGMSNEQFDQKCENASIVRSCRLRS